MRALQYSKAFPARHDGDKKLCRWPECSAVLSGRRTSFCSDGCRDKAMIRCWPTEQRKQTFRRDRGICAGCGVDCIAAMKIMGRHEGYIAEPHWHDRGRMMRHTGLMASERFLGFSFGNRSTFWEANHIVPVVEGGSSDLDNLETLCLLCHRNHTTALKRRLSKKGAA